MDRKNSSKTTKGLLGGASPRLIFIFGVVAGLAFFSLLSLVLLIAVIFGPGLKKEVIVSPPVEKEEETEEMVEVESEEEINKFKEKETEEICLENGKPVIRLFSTTWCPHCQWIAETFDKVAREYQAEGKIAAYHWELDTKDNTLTEEEESEIPEEEMAIFRQFNPRGSIPTFIFGCKYWRVGTAYERENDLTKEEADFREIIEKLIEEGV